MKTKLMTALALFTLAGCQPDLARVDLEVASAPDLDAYVDAGDGEVLLPAGIGIVVRARPVSSTREDYEASDRVDIVTRDPDVARVYPVFGEHRHFAITGVRPGTATLDVYIDDAFEGRIDAVVTSP